MKIPLRLVCHVADIEEPRYDYNVSTEKMSEYTSILWRMRCKENVGLNVKEADCDDG